MSDLDAITRQVLDDIDADPETFQALLDDAKHTLLSTGKVRWETPDLIVEVTLGD